MEVRLESTGGPGRQAEVWVGPALLVVMDFGLMCMEDANWTNDEKLVGRFVCVSIDRLSLTHHESDRWPEYLR